MWDGPNTGPRCPSEHLSDPRERYRAVSEVPLLRTFIDSLKLNYYRLGTVSGGDFGSGVISVKEQCRCPQAEQKSAVELKGKSWLDQSLQCGR